MDLENLKNQTQIIKNQYAAKRYVCWPKPSKKEIAKLSLLGKTPRQVEELTGISASNVVAWNKIFNPKKSNKISKTDFKEINIMDNSTQSKSINLSWNQSGLEIKNLSFDELKNLLTNKLI